MVSLALLPYTISQALAVGCNPRTKLNLTPYACKFLKDEPDNLKFYLDDGMARKSLTYIELLESFLIVRSLRPVGVAPEIPILVLRGKKDRVCTENSVKRFLTTLRSDNLSIHTSLEGGHLLLQTARIDEDLNDALDGWIGNVIAKKRQGRTPS